MLINRVEIPEIKIQIIMSRSTNKTPSLSLPFNLAHLCFVAAVAVQVPVASSFETYLIFLTSFIHMTLTRSEVRFWPLGSCVSSAACVWEKRTGRWKLIIKKKCRLRICAYLWHFRNDEYQWLFVFVQVWTQIRLILA